MKIILITHAHTEVAPESAADNWRLSSDGEAQTAQLARAGFWAEVTQVVVSSEAKTRLTVVGICRERQLPIWVDARFDELRRNGWVQAYAEAVMTALIQPDVSHRGWEPADSALRRGLAGLAALRLRFPGETLALVGHGIQLSLLRAHFMQQATVDLDEWARLPFAAVAAIDMMASRVLEDFPYGDQARTRV